MLTPISKVMPDALNIPPFLDSNNVDIWLEQQIWGHRFLDEQTPWLLLLEAIGLMAFRAEDQNSACKIFTGPSDTHENMRYEMKANKRLRKILFADRNIDEIAEQQAVSDAVLWNMWFKSCGLAGEEDFGYLKSRFVKFASFRNAVALLRGSEVEPEITRRLTSRHLAPRGPAMLSADYGEGRKKGAGIDKDRKHFARGGELLFLMLNRSGVTEKLEPLVKQRLLSAKTRWNRLAEHLSPPIPENPVAFENIGYLPLKEHNSYKILGEDWLSILSLSQLPDDHLSEPLMRLSALSVIRYIVERSAKVTGNDRPLIPIDVMGPNTVGIRKLSRDAFALHRDMSRKAIERVVYDFINSQSWVDACKQPNPTKAALDLVKLRFGFEPKDASNRNLDALPKNISEEALDHHNGHLGRIVGLYSEQIGLATRRGSSRWYVLSDTMLEAIVLANVVEPMEFEAFLEKLYIRYGFMIGNEVASRCYTNINYQQVKNNQRHLEQRLRMLGLLKRLSDDCAFVVNPFWSDRET